jgi:argininosuccinate lyase
LQAFLKRSEGQLENVMVGYTHVQHAQPISVAYWLTHYAAIFLRDLDRLKFAYDHTDQNPLGAGMPRSSYVLFLFLTFQNGFGFGFGFGFDFGFGFG